jgi:hypothetical protein
VFAPGAIVLEEIDRRLNRGKDTSIYKQSDNNQTASALAMRGVHCHNMVGVHGQELI